MKDRKQVIAELLATPEASDMARELLIASGFDHATVSYVLHSLTLSKSERDAKRASRNGMLPEKYGRSAKAKEEIDAAHGIGALNYDSGNANVLPYIGTTIPGHWREASAHGVDVRGMEGVDLYRRFLDPDDRRNLIRFAEAYRDAKDEHKRWFNSLSKNQRKHMHRDQRSGSWVCPVCKGTCAIYDRSAPEPTPVASVKVTGFALRCSAVAASIMTSTEQNLALLRRLGK